VTAPAGAISFPSLLSEILQGIGGTVSSDVKTWIVSEYATIQALPSQLAQLQKECVAIGAAAQGQPNLASTVAAQLAIVQGLVATYPTLAAQVQALQASVQAGAGLTTAIDGTATITSAQDFLNQVASVDSALQSVVNQLLATGAITPAQATALYTNLANTSSTGWGTYLLYGLGAIVLYKILK
jgi:hypothetical protein